MANKTKGAAQAAQQAAPKQNKNEQQENDFAKVVKAAQGGLSGDGKVMLAHLIDKRWVGNPNMPAAVTDGANVLVDSLMADVIVTNIVEGREMFSLIVRNDEQKYLSIQAMLGSMGIKTPEFNALPAPTQEALDAANVKLLPTETKVINISKENVSTEAVEQKKKELDNEKKQPTNDPTKIENDQQLAESLLALLTSATLSPEIPIQTKSVAVRLPNKCTGFALAVVIERTNIVFAVTVEIARHNTIFYRIYIPTAICRPPFAFFEFLAVRQKHIEKKVVARCI